MNSLLANKLFSSVCELTKYNISIIDENGKILACQSEEHIGAFNETAFELIKSENTLTTINIDNPESGLREGVYMTLFSENRKIGVLGVYGNPTEVLAIARIMKHSLETQLEFELFKQNAMRKYSAKERVLKAIFSNDFEYADLELALKGTSLDQDATRVPVLFEAEDSLKHTSQITKLLSSSALSSKEDLVGITPNGAVFILKSVSGNTSTILENYKYMLGEYLSDALQYIRKNNIAYSLYVGPIQNNILYYHQAFLYCQWMQNYIRRPGSYYFYDYIVPYFSSTISLHECNAIFSYLKRVLGSKFTENYIEIMYALMEKGYDLSSASTILHIHKNTLVYRLDKIREILNMNPLNNNNEREFMECFYYYLTHNQNL